MRNMKSNYKLLKIKAENHIKAISKQNKSLKVAMIFVKLFLLDQFSKSTNNIYICNWNLNLWTEMIGDTYFNCFASCALTAWICLDMNYRFQTVAYVLLENQNSFCKMAVGIVFHVISVQHISSLSDVDIFSCCQYLVTNHSIGWFYF